MELFALAPVLLMLLMLFLLFIGLVFYLLEAYVVYSIASKKGLNNAWVSWIPGGSKVVICLMTEQQAPKFVRGKLFLIYLITLLITIVTSFSGNGSMILIGSVCSILLAVIQYMTFYYLVSQYSDSAVAHLVIAILTLGLSMIISLYMIKNRERIDGTQEGNEIPSYSNTSNETYETENTVKTEIPKMPEFKEENETIEKGPKKPHIVEAPEITKIEEEIEDSKKKSIVIDNNIPVAPRTPSEGPAPEEDVEEEISIDGLPKFESNTEKSDSKDESILNKESKNKLNLEKNEKKPPL